MMDTQKQKSPKSFREVSSYQAENGVSIIICRQNNKFGVLMRRAQGIAFAPHYGSNADAYLQTSQGNELDIIDWVDRQLACARFSHLVLAEVNRMTQRNGTTSNHGLRLVHG